MTDSTNHHARQATTEESVRWIKCKGCCGDVGIPTDWSSDTVECPECGQEVKVHGRLLYRPPAEVPAAIPVPSAPIPANPAPAQLLQRQPSLELGRKADQVLIFGIVSILLGWTIIVPLAGWAGYSDTSSQAKKEQVPIPSKATVGLILCLLFGIAQGFAVLHSLKIL